MDVGTGLCKCSQYRPNDNLLFFDFILFLLLLLRCHIRFIVGRHFRIISIGSYILYENIGNYPSMEKTRLFVMGKNWIQLSTAKASRVKYTNANTDEIFRNKTVYRFAEVCSVSLQHRYKNKRQKESRDETWFCRFEPQMLNDPKPCALKSNTGIIRKLCCVYEFVCRTFRILYNTFVLAFV